MTGLDRLVGALFGPGVAEIESAEARKLLESEGRLIVIDVRQPAEFRSGHLPGAVSWPLIGGGDPLAEWLSADRIIVVCASGHRSQIGGRRLLKAGAKRVVSLRGGTAGWRAGGGATQS